MYVRLATIALLALGVALPLTAQSWRGGSDVEIRVLNRKKKPLTSARVQLTYREDSRSDSPPPLLTDDKGRVVFYDLAAGAWHLEASHPGNLSFVAVLNVPAGGKPEITASFLQATGDGIEPTRVVVQRAKGGQRITFREAPRRPRPEAEPVEIAEATAPAVEPAVSPPPATPEPIEAPPADTPPVETPTPPPPSTETVEVETVDVEPVEVEPVQIPAPVEPVQVEPVQAEPTRVEPVQVEPTQAQPPPPIEPAPTEPAEVEIPDVEPDPIEPPSLPEAPLPQPELPEPEMPAEAIEPPTPRRVVVTPDESEATEIETAPEPTTTPPPPAAPKIDPANVVPAPPRMGASILRDPESAEWAAASESVVPPGGAAPCPAGLEDAVRRAMWLIASSPRLELASFAGPVDDDSGDSAIDRLSSARRERVEELLAPYASAAGCEPIAVVLPKSAQFIAFHLLAGDSTGAGECEPEFDCPIGKGGWVSVPKVGRGPSATVVYGIFRNAHESHARRIRLTARFIAPSGAWEPPSAP